MYVSGALPRDTMIGELVDARSRRLTKQLNKPAQFTFVLDGHSPSAGVVQELATDVIVWRWNDTYALDTAMFRGVVNSGQDTVSEQTATVTFTAIDYGGMLARRFRTDPLQLRWPSQDQDDLVKIFLDSASAINGALGAGYPFTPGSYLPLDILLVDPGNVNRAKSGQLRDRTIIGQQSYGELIDNMAHVVNGFDYDVLAGGAYRSTDAFRVFFPYQGVQKSTPQLVYGSTISALTRTVSSTDYANYQRVLGNNQSTDPLVAQLYGEAWNTDSNNVSVAPQGLWMHGSQDSDVTVKQTLIDHAQGALATSGVIVPSYSVTLRPGFYQLGDAVTGFINMGDVLPLIVQEGRLNINTNVRVVGIDYEIGDDGDEKVTLTLGRPDVTIQDIFAASAADVNALARR